MAGCELGTDDPLLRASSAQGVLQPLLTLFCYVRDKVFVCLFVRFDLHFVLVCFLVLFNL